MTPERSAQGRCFRLAQFGELPRRVDDRAVMLTQLRAIAGNRFDGRRESLIGEPIGNLLDRQRSVLRKRSDKTPSSLGCERGHGLPTIPFRQEPQGLQSQRVVCLVACGSTGTGQGENGAGTTTAWVGIGTEGGAIEGLDEPGLLQSP